MREAQHEADLSTSIRAMLGVRRMRSDAGGRIRVKVGVPRILAAGSASPEVDADLDGEIHQGLASWMLA